MENRNEYLPIGSVVLLENGNKRLMIFGIIQSEVGNPSVEYDYIGVPYPEGNMGDEYQYLFYHKDIKEIFFKGFEDVERQIFMSNLVEYYNENNDNDTEEDV